MPGEFFTLSLQAVVKEKGVEGTNEILSTFSCSINEDIEVFLKDKAMGFSDQRIARTHLVLCDSGKSFELLGYYTLANKILTVSPEGLSNTVKRKFERFGILDSTTKLYNVATPLIAQLGKNYSNGLNHIITGGELLKSACDKIVAVQNEIGGALIYLECDNRPALLDFYQKNGFRIMERGMPSDKNLVQLVRFL